MVGGVPAEHLAAARPDMHRPLADPLDYLQKVISVASTEAFTPRLVEGDLSEGFRFRRRVEAMGHRNSARAFRSTSSAETNSTSPASICVARCGARRMAASAALLIDEVLPPLLLRQWVLTLPIPLRLLCATDTRALSEILRIVHRCLCGHLISAAHLKKHSARAGAITFIQRFGGSVNLHIHFHILALDGVYRVDPTARTLLHFRRSHPPTPQQLEILDRSIIREVCRKSTGRGPATM
jgi:hypothetical protein